MWHLCDMRYPILAGLILFTSTLRGALPDYDHIVIVVEENHSRAQIIGNRAEAPFINALASRGVSLTNMAGITHPSQPNYLEFFSGDFQGVQDNNKPAVFPFTTPNLGAALLAAGRSFIGYADDLPAPGDATTVMTFYPDGGDRYARKHVPWTNWQSSTIPQPPNTLPPSVNQPFTAFPTNFDLLPDVAIVVPNEQHDMHSGPNRVAAGDQWLAQNLRAYASWAVTHNSLLIVTWDEDDYFAANQIATVFYGAHLRPGENDGGWTLHHLLRTIADLTGAAPMGKAAEVSRITGIFEGDAPVMTRTFRHGPTYRGADDIALSESLSDSANATSAFGTVGIDASGKREQVLLRFGDLFGSGAGQLPADATIISAQVTLQTGPLTTDGTTQPATLHRLLQPFTAASTWNSLGAGVSTDDVEAAAVAEFTATALFGSQAARFDVTTTLQDFAQGGANNGWLVKLSSTDEWRFELSENVDFVGGRPRLEVTFAASELAFDAAAVRVRESSGRVSVVVHRTGSLSSAATCYFTTTDGSAIAGLDYTTKRGTLTWAAGDASDRTVVIPIRRNPEIEGRETFTVRLRSPGGIGKVGAIGQTTVVILE